MFLVVDELLDKREVFGWDFTHLLTGQYFEFIGLFDKITFEVIKLMREIVSFVEHLFSKDIDLGDFFEDMFLLLRFWELWLAELLGLWFGRFGLGEQHWLRDKG
jgi:hypothetical protein